MEGGQGPGGDPRRRQRHSRRELNRTVPTRPRTAQQTEERQAP